MPIRIVRLGTPRPTDEGLRLGTVRRPPRGVKKSDYAKRDFYDVWLPDLAPTAPLVKWALSVPWTAARFKTYARKYRAEMAKPAQKRLVALLAAMSKTSNFSVGCYCADENFCHRSLLRELLMNEGAEIT
jgi:uncharacterized protein YeaO (DUF488 family)